MYDWKWQGICLLINECLGWSALHYTAAVGLWSLLVDMAMKDGVDLDSISNNNEMIEDCPEDRVNKTKCKGM